MLLTRSALLFLRSSVKFQGHMAQNIIDFDPNWAFPDCNSSLNSLMAMKWCTKLDVAWKRCFVVVEGHPSNFKVTWDKKSVILARIKCFWIVTQVWNHWWLWNDEQSSTWYRRVALLLFQVHPSNFKVTHDKKSLILTRIEHFWTVTPVWIHSWIWNDAQRLMLYRRGTLLFYKVINQISMWYGLKNWWLEFNLSKITRPVAAIQSFRFTLFVWVQLA